MKLTIRLLSIVCIFISINLRAQSHWKILPNMPIKICGSGTNFIIDRFFYSVDCKDSLFNLWKYDLNLHTNEQVYRYQNSNDISAGSNFIILNNSVFANLTIGFKNAGLYKYFPGTNIYEYKNTSLFGSDYLQFVINELGYFLSIGYGNKEYNPITNTWTSKAPFPGFQRQYGVAFAIGNKGYYGMGTRSPSYLNDMWQYNPDSNTWKQMANYNGYIAGGSLSPKVFVIGNDAYLMGIEKKERLQNAPLSHSFFTKYNAAANTWQLISDTLPAPVGNFDQTGFAFSLNGKGYVYTGTSTDNFWEYDPKDIRLQAVSPATAACVVDTILVHYNIVPYKNYNITAQLSSVDDNFSNPITLAIFSDSTGADSIKMALPQGLHSNQNYMIRLISSAGDTSLSERFQINLHPQKPIITKLSNTQLHSTAAAAYQWYLNGNGIANSNTQNITITQNGSYTVRVDSTNACGTFSDTLVANFVGIENVLGSSLHLYPNPIKNKLQVNISHDELEELHIYDSYGRLIKTVLLSNKTNEVEIDMSDVQEGFYFVSIKSENVMFNKKVMVVK